MPPSTSEPEHYHVEVEVTNGCNGARSTRRWRASLEVPKRDPDTDKRALASAIITAAGELYAKLTLTGWKTDRSTDDR